MIKESLPLNTLALYSKKLYMAPLKLTPSTSLAGK